MALQEMIVRVSTTLCFPEPPGQRPGQSTMPSRAAGPGERGLGGSPECGGSESRPRGLLSCLLYPSSSCKPQTPLASATGARERQGIREPTDECTHPQGHSTGLGEAITRQAPSAHWPLGWALLCLLPQSTPRSQPLPVGQLLQAGKAGLWTLAPAPAVGVQIRVDERGRNDKSLGISSF